MFRLAPKSENVMRRNISLNNTDEHDYDAFISYSHDSYQLKIVRAAQRALHAFARPWHHLRSLRLYRDETNLSARPDLWAGIRKALDRSKYMILVASRRSATSRWVQQEVAHWLERNGSERIIIIVTDGQIIWDSTVGRFSPGETDALPPAAIEGIASEPLWIDLSWARTLNPAEIAYDARFRDAMASVAATLRGVDKDTIIGEDLSRRRSARRLATGALILIGTLLIVSSLAALGLFQQFQEAVSQRDQTRVALMHAAAREAQRVVGGGDAEEGWRGLQQSIQEPSVGANQPSWVSDWLQSATGLSIGTQQSQFWLPTSVHEAGLLSLLENRFGPTLNFPLSPRSREMARTGLTHYIDGAARFSPNNHFVAAGAYFDLGVWRVDDGYRLHVVSLPHLIERIDFSEQSRILLAIGQAFDVGNSRRGALFVTALDVESGNMQTYELRRCRGLIPCIARDAGAAVRLHDIRASSLLLDTVRGVLPPSGQGLIVPTLDHMGVSQGRYHLLLLDKTARVVVFDQFSQISRSVSLPTEPISMGAAAAGRATAVVGSPLDDRLWVLTFSSNRTNSSFDARVTTTLRARQSAGTRDLYLDDDASTVYYTNNRWGTGAGNGSRLTGAIDIRSQRHLWYRRFEGRVLPAFDNSQRAEVSAGYSRTVRGETGEYLFTVRGEAWAFSRDGRTLLLHSGWGDFSTDTASWRLSEALPLRSLARAEDAELPLSLRGICGGEDQSAFRVTGARETQRWNRHDWRRITDRRIVEALLSSPIRSQPPARTFALDWRGQEVAVTPIRDSSGEEVALPPAVPESPLQIAASYPEIQGARFEPDVTRIVLLDSADGRWRAVTSVYRMNEDSGLSRFAWTVFDMASGANGAIVVSGEAQYFDSSPLHRDGEATVHFVDGLPVFFARDDDCGMSLYHLPSGSSRGRVQLPFMHNVSVEPAGGGLFALTATDWYAATQVIQIVSLFLNTDNAEIRQGPSMWLSHDQSDAGQESAPASQDQRERALVPIACPCEVSFSPDGEYMVLEGEASDPGTPSAASGSSVVLRVPPWGQRLDTLIRGREGGR